MYKFIDTASSGAEQWIYVVIKYYSLAFSLAVLDQYEEESLFDAPENANADDAATISTIGDYDETAGTNPDDPTTISTTVHNENAAENQTAVAAAVTHGADGRCGECGEAIGSEDRRTVYRQKAYHPRCFTCHKCKLEKLSGLDGFYVNDGRKYCVDCYNNNVAERCTGCGEVRKLYTNGLSIAPGRKEVGRTLQR